MKKKVDKVCSGVQPNEGVTELVFILDKSGSMAGMEKDTIGGFNAMIDKQKAMGGKVFVSTVLFSTLSQVLHDRERLEDVSPLTENDYQVGGCTALVDAIGGAIKHIGNIHKYARKDDVPTRTLFVITTDGLENASKKYQSAQIKAMIKEKEENCGWEFLFLAANIDAVSTAESIGIRKERAVNYKVEDETVEMFEEVGDTICEYRACCMPSECGSRIEENIRLRREKAE